jgi:D-alanine-D-alanine ligase
LVLYNEPTLPADHPDADSEHDILYTADTVVRILQQAGLTVARLGVTDDPQALLTGLTAAAPDVVFNLYEGMAKWGNTEAFVSGILELLRLPFTGSPTQPLMLCRSKPLTKKLLAGAGVPTASFFVVEDGPVPECPLPWPVIVKPGTEDASVGIDQASVVTSQRQLVERVEYIRATYGPSVLVERFVRGREFNVAVVERDGELTTLPFSEILFVPPTDKPGLWPIVSFDAKWRPGTTDFVATPATNPAENVSPQLHAAVAGLAKKAFQLVGCRDYARVDFRVDESGQPFVLEVNPNPCISPLAGLAAALETAKVPYNDFIVGLVKAALARGGRSFDTEAEAAGPATVVMHGPTTRRAATRVRPAKRSDLPALADLLARADCWSADDRRRAADRLSDWLGRRTRDGDRCLVLTAHGELLGAAAVRPSDAGHGVFALDWLVIAPARRRHGYGRTLLQAVESTVIADGGRLLTAAVTSGPSATAGRHFLSRTEFHPAGEVPEFYRDGYSRLTFARPVAAAAAAPAASRSAS